MVINLLLYVVRVNTLLNIYYKIFIVEISNIKQFTIILWNKWNIQNLNIKKNIKNLKFLRFALIVFFIGLNLSMII